MTDRHLRVDDMKWVYSECVLTDVDGDSGRDKDYSYFYTLIPVFLYLGVLAQRLNLLLRLLLQLAPELGEGLWRARLRR
jgi:hypothetical protein